MSSVVHLNSENFDSSVAGKVALIDFWAEWCGPCRMFSPVLDELAGEVADDIVIAKINVDDAPDIAARFGVRNVPAIFILKNGEVIRQFSGTQDKMTLAQEIANA